MKYLLFGGNGQLGTDIQKVFGGQDLAVLTHRDVEIADPKQVQAILLNSNPDVIINTAAFHNVPQCEKDPSTAFQVNALGVKNLITAIEQLNRPNIKLVHISTDYVFDGQKKTPYQEGDAPAPLNAYAISKVAGEQFAKTYPNHYIVRVASLFGITGCRAKGGKNFVSVMLSAAQGRASVEVVSNIVSSPTYTVDAAQQIKNLLDGGYPPGIYHAANAGACSWFEFAQEIFKQSGIRIEVLPKIEGAQQAGVSRPLYSALESTKLKPLRHWREALGAYLHEAMINA